MHLSEISVKKPVAIGMFFIGMILLGLVSLSRLSVDLLPDLPEFSDKTGASIHSAILYQRAYYLAFCEDAGK